MGFRLGKVEKAVLGALAIWHDADPGWTWHEGQGFGKLAEDDDIERYKRGDIVPMWMLRRDIDCGKTVLSRALKTLHEKELIFFRDGTLGLPERPLTCYAKYVSLTAEGLKKGEDLRKSKVLSKMARLQS